MGVSVPMANKNLFKAPFLRTGLRMPDSNLGELGIEWKSRGGSEGDDGGGGNGDGSGGDSALVVVVDVGCMEI